MPDVMLGLESGEGKTGAGGSHQNVKLQRLLFTGGQRYKCKWGRVYLIEREDLRRLDSSDS